MYVYLALSGVKGSLYKVSTAFVCTSCTADESIPAMAADKEELDIGSGVLFEKVDVFCYLGDMLKADGGCGM